MKRADRTERGVSRRDALKLTGGAALAAALVKGCTETRPLRAGTKGVTKGRIKQSVAHWCFGEVGWTLDQTCQATKKLGCQSVEVVGPKDWPTLKKYGLICAIAPNGMPDPPFVKGLNNPKYHQEVISRTRETIDACADWGFPNVIAFTGDKWRTAQDPKSGEISREEGAANCVEGFKKIVGYAEQKAVTLCMEILNTRDDTHPMKGHPGYQGDDTDYMAGIVRRVGSPRLKLLFDVYHVQIMNGDIIRRIEQTKDIIGHVHVAGNPGRNELDENQEINYPAVMRKLLQVGYKGFVGQEFIPTRDPMESLAQAVRACDV